MPILIKEFKELYNLSYGDLAKACRLPKSTVQRREGLKWLVWYDADSKKLTWESSHNGGTIVTDNVDLDIEL